LLCVRLQIFRSSAAYIFHPFIFFPLS
jgi:hypothetical protein